MKFFFSALVLLSMTCSCIFDDNIRKAEDIYHAESIEIIVPSSLSDDKRLKSEETIEKSQQPEISGGKEKKGTDLSELLKNYDSDQLRKMKNHYASFLNCSDQELLDLGSKIKRKIADKDKVCLAQAYLSVLKNGDFDNTHRQAEKSLLDTLMELAYDKNNEDIQFFIENHIPENIFVAVINKNDFVLAKIREHAYLKGNKAAERVYDKILHSSLPYDLSEQVIQQETEALWRLYEESIPLREKINRVWVYLYLPEKFVNLNESVRYESLDRLLRTLNLKESGNTFLEGICSKILSRDVLERFSSENRVYFLFSLFGYALDDSFFHKTYFDSILDKDIRITDKKDMEWYEDVYLSFARYMNYVHGTDKDWQTHLEDVLRHRSDRELYFFMSATSYDLYNATFMLLYKEQVRRVRQAGGLFSWLKKTDGDNRLVPMCFLSLLNRNKFIEFVRHSANTRKQKQISQTLRQTCDLIRKQAESHSQANDYDNIKHLGYLSYAVENLLRYDDPKVNAYLTSLLIELANGNFLSSIFSRAIIKKFPEFFSDHEVRHSAVDPVIEDVLRYLDTPPYESIVKKKNKFRVLIDFSDTSEEFIFAQKKILGLDKMIEPNDEQLKKGIIGIYRRNMKGMRIEYHLAKNIVGQEFRKIVEENHYSLIFTRHHSYENEQFIGQGSDSVIPQIWSNIDIGYGNINSRMSLILTEEIVRAYVSGREKWDKIIKRVRSRMHKYFETFNFSYPNDLPLVVSYASLLADKHYSFNQNKVVFYDGACAGSVRTLFNIFKYRNSMLTDTRKGLPNK